MPVVLGSVVKFMEGAEGRGEETYIALKSAAFVDGEDEDYVFAGLECFFENAAVLNLGRPDRLRSEKFSRVRDGYGGEGDLRLGCNSRRSLR